MLFNGGKKYMERDNEYDYHHSNIIKNTLKSYYNSNYMITPKFFGEPSMMDFVRDMEICKKLDIEFKNKPRSRIKAEILSYLTGETVETMHNFYTSSSYNDLKNTISWLKNLKLLLTENKLINKAIIINTLIELKQAPENI